MGHSLQPGNQKNGTCPRRPDAAEKDARDDRMENRLEPRQREAAPARLLGERPAEQRGPVVISEGEERAPAEFSRIDGGDRGENNFGGQHEHCADQHGRRSARPAAVDVKRPPVAGREPLGDQRRDCRPKARHDQKLDPHAPEHHAPADRPGERERDREEESELAGVAHEKRAQARCSLRNPRRK